MRRILVILLTLLMVFKLTENSAFTSAKSRFGANFLSISKRELNETQLFRFIPALPPETNRTQKEFIVDDEVRAAVSDYPGFKKLAKFPGLPADVKANLRKNFLPELGSPAIIEGHWRSQRLNLLIERLLAVHTVSGQCEIVIVRSRVPSVLTWKLTFITFTNAAVDILNDDELNALAGHEIGHLYYASDLAEARAAGDNRRARIIELKADLVALETLNMLGIQTTNLLSAIEKLIEARKTLKINSMTPMSPSIEDRIRLITEYKNELNAVSVGKYHLNYDIK